MELKDEVCNEVCNMELSKRLCELGEKQESLWWWHIHPESDSYFVDKKQFGSSDGMSSPICSAFTVTELGERLPESIWHNSRKYFRNDLRCNASRKTMISYWTNDKIMLETNLLFESEINARAKMLIYLLENKLIGEG